MKKLKLKPVIEYDGRDKYVFIGGIAKVPGMWDKQGGEYTVTIKEFNEGRLG
jgi:hypothetical protein